MDAGWVSRALAWGMLLCSPIMLLCERFLFPVPMGKLRDRHTSGIFATVLSPQWAWFIMEAPAFFAFVITYAYGPERSNTTALLLLALWVLHYGHRTFVYPLQVSSRSVAFAIWALGAFYNVINGFMNAYAVAHQPAAAADRHTQPSFLLGAALFVCGKAINMWADARLTALRPAAERARGEHRYVLPRGGLFELVSCPHYFGELVMWGGWALAAASLPALAFFVFCVCNIGARALSHHEWYRLRFKETMPPARKALVPYLL